VTPSPAPPLPAGLLTTVARFAVLAGVLSVVVPYFVGLTTTLAALAIAVWAVVRRSAPPAKGGWRGWAAGGGAAAVGWSVALGAQGPWLAARGPALAAMTVVLWTLARSGGGRGPAL
jgi:hypothetical protein